MAISTTKNSRTGGGGSGPHFFKIILDEALRDGKLFIPTKFLRKYGNNLQNRIILKDPTGTEWPVELTNSEGEIWLDKGFPEFAKFYSLSYGYLVVFQLQFKADDDDDCFKIVVFDPTATEINYPPIQQQLQTNPTSVEEEDSTSVFKSDDDSTSDSESDGEVRILSRQSSELDPPSPKIRRTISSSDVGRCKSKSSYSELGASAPAKVLDKATGENRRGSLSKEEKREAIDRARSAFTSKNPSFVLAVQPSYLSPLPNVAIPLSFAKEHLKDGNGKAILVRVSDGRKWKVNCTVSCDPAGPAKRMKAWFGGSGWKDFALGNQLSVGDVCAFELTTTTTSVSFGVTIFRNYKQPWTWMST